ncbi:MAG: hypothetical protein HXY43_15955 [Fischerella sp.]|uniref:hypothetical protein n=1 Tax=Fischerella sp. TaxID=1191 RepID=UPI0017AE4974|nr:hypothetical protein [Fischerella sp.]NWF60706.1 hypothetical protein [Fischerella sp.]
MNCHSERNFVERRILTDATLREAAVASTFRCAIHPAGSRRSVYSMTKSNSYFKSATPEKQSVIYADFCIT